MIARGALQKVHLSLCVLHFSSSTIINTCVYQCIECDNMFQNTKYTLLQMMPDTKSARFLAVSRSTSMDDICGAFGRRDHYQQVIKQWQESAYENEVPKSAQNIRSSKKHALEKGGIYEEEEEEIFQRIQAR